MSERAATRQRPAGYAPRKTSLGLYGHSILGAGVPFCTLQSLVPVVASGLDLWIGSILPVLGFAFVLVLIMALGLHKRHYWYICYIFYASSLLLVAYVVGFSVGLAILLHLVRLQHQDLAFISVINIIMWLVLAPFAWLLLRMLRLRYWQPWTRPDEWEPGDETPPRWGMSAPPPASVADRKRR